MENQKIQNWMIIGREDQVCRGRTRCVVDDVEEATSFNMKLDNEGP